MQQNFAITIDWRAGYEFSIDFEQPGVSPLTVDEPAPLGAGVGPNPSRLLAAAVGNCMSASLRFCLERAHIELEDMKTTVVGTMVRNERGRLRIEKLAVQLQPTLSAENAERMTRCADMFEDFCIVGQSVRSGIDLQVAVLPTVTATP